MKTNRLDIIIDSRGKVRNHTFRYDDRADIDNVIVMLESMLINSLESEDNEQLNLPFEDDNVGQEDN